MISFLLLLFCILVQVTHSHPAPLPLAIPVTSTSTSLDDDTPTQTSTATLTSTSTPTNTDNEEQLEMETTYIALRQHIYSYRNYYATANPELYSSFESLKDYEQFVSNIFPDGGVEYSIYNCMLSFLTVMPSSISSHFESLLTDNQDWYDTVTSINMTPITTTPTMSTWDTSISVPTSGVYSSFYMLAKCRAMVEDGLKYGHWYDEYFFTNFDDSNRGNIAMMYHNIKTDATEVANDGLPILNGGGYQYYCEEFIGLLDGMPWKERVLNLAKSRYVSYSSAFTTPITLEDQYTTLKPNNYGEKKLSGGAIAGIVVGCLVIVAIVVVVIVVAVCMKKRSKYGKENVPIE
ncbi:unnamed protein product [Ambrosiozyma monospora]|uniref:Unnamed protein product n=1 Tax=Ambrosiozyma monospora TaxID=43982 RepID=A0ACB5SZB2_AMBMO|nr:unnamed protein product [Ambrosiozyma monospora]